MLRTVKNTTIFHHILGTTLIASVTNMFVWFAVTFWVFLQTDSVLATSYVAGIFAVANMLSAFVFGSIVDHTRKKTVMIYSSTISLVCYLFGLLLVMWCSPDVFTNATSPILWIFVLVVVFGSVAGNMRTIALATTVTMLFQEGRDKANGLVGAVNGVSFSLTSILSGLAIGFSTIEVVMFSSIIGTCIALLYVWCIPLYEAEIVHTDHDTSKFDFKQTFRIVSGIQGLFMLIFFTTFNNFLGGVFMALMDAYGLSLVSVQVWGTMFAIASLGFIVGSGYIAKYGLGQNPLRSMLLVNVVTWTTCIFFTIQPSALLLFGGMIIWMSLIPFIEATEHTVIQSVVPFERQGRVFGFAQSIESAATPITTFLIGPIATFIFIPFMTTGAGVDLIGSWFGVGQDRGIALVFIVAGCIGLLVTLCAFRTRAYHILSTQVPRS